MKLGLPERNPKDASERIKRHIKTCRQAAQTAQGACRQNSSRRQRVLPRMAETTPKGVRRTHATNATTTAASASPVGAGGRVPGRTATGVGGRPTVAPPKRGTDEKGGPAAFRRRRPPTRSAGRTVRRLSSVGVPVLHVSGDPVSIRWRAALPHLPWTATTKHDAGHAERDKQLLVLAVVLRDGSRETRHSPPLLRRSRQKQRSCVQ